MNVAERAFLEDVSTPLFILGILGSALIANQRERTGKTGEEKVKELMNRVEANDAGLMYVLGCQYNRGENGLQQDQEKA